MSISCSSVETIAFGGTLGDAFIVLCKLYNQYKTEGKHFRLIRHSTRPEMDGIIEKMFKTVSFIEYPTPCRAFNNIEELYYALRNSPYGIVNTKWQKGDLETYFIDYGNLNPYPVFEIPITNVPRDRLNVGIQLHCGAEGANGRGFSLRWLEKIRRNFPSKDFCIYLFGTGTAYYPETAIEDSCKKHRINNLVGKLDFAEWLSYIKSMDAFISLEGFAALFAMSQKVTTIEYNQYPRKLDGSVCPAWRKDNIIFNINSNRLLRKIRYWKRKYMKLENLYLPRNLPYVRDFICNSISNDTNAN